MKNRKLLAIILLSLSFCFVSGVGYGEIPEWMLESTVSYIDFELLRSEVSYIMAKPDDFLMVSYYYDLTGGFAEKFPVGVRTKGKVYISIRDSRGVFSYKSSKALLEQFVVELFAVYYFIQSIVTDKNVDIVVEFVNKEGKTIGYFYQGEYHLWED